MKLIPNAGRTLLRSWTLWCVYASALSELAPYLIPYLDGYLPPWVSIALLVASIPMRVITQRSLSGEQPNADQ